MQGNITEHSYSVLSGSTCPNGKTAKGWEHFDQIISRFLVEQKIPGAAVAVSKKGVILYQQGYGAAGAGCRVHEDSMFRIASISKPVTAAIVVQLFDKLKMPLNTTVFGKTGILKSYRTRDKRMKNITVRHLLQHSAGWDRDKVGDAVFVRPQCVVKEHPDSQTYNSALLAYALRRKLQFSPGTWHSYSNLGYLVLGEIIETLSGQPYHRVLQTFLQDLSISGIIVGKRRRSHYKCREVEYFNNREPPVVNSIYPEEGTVLPQYGGMAMESSASYGGLVADTVSLLRFIDCMEEAVNQSNTNDYRGQPDNTAEAALNMRTDAEQLVPEDQHCQSATQQLVMETCDRNNFYGSERVNKDSCYDHTSRADKRVSSSIVHIISGVGANERHLYYENESSVVSCEPDRNLDSRNVRYNSSVLDSKHGKNLDPTGIQCNFSVVGCESGQNRHSANWQYNSNHVFCQSSQTFETCTENKCSTCNLTVTANEYWLLPLMTSSQATDSLSRPEFENGRDWYGLGWDVQDNGKSWGHTGGMDGSCGTLFHHQSGLNWTFLLNSWAADADLNGVIKCALCSLPDAGMYGQDILTTDSDFGLKIVTKDKSQIICLCVSESTLSKIISHVKADGFIITWISTVRKDFSYIATKLLHGKKINKLQQWKYPKSGKKDPQIKYIAIFKKYHIMDYFVLFRKTGVELQSLINDLKKYNFVISFLDTFVDSEAQLKYTAVFKYDRCVRQEDDIVVLLAMAASDYVKQVKSYLCSHYVVVQSVTEISSQLYVSAILFARNSHDTTTLLPHIERSTESCTDHPDKNSDSYVNVPGKVTNVLDTRNAESPKAYSNTIVHDSTESKTLDHNINNDYSSTLPVLQTSEDIVFLQSKGQTEFQELREDSVFQGKIFDVSDREKLFQESVKESVFHKLPGKTKVRESTEETANMELATNSSNKKVLKITSNLHSTRSKTNRKHKCYSVTNTQTKFQAKKSKKSKNQTASSLNSTYWVQITPESFLTELNRQTRQNSSLVYAHFYNSDRKPYVSGCWCPTPGGKCYQRISMSKYGLVPELVEAASENVYLQCLSEYLEDGVVYYAAIWQAG
ncbi:unnamed protein product [Candidula unifasciata]|uniref:Beta-lactamase-related domain-containing protein n=1 Tax=Candidula unifasciata TaxID=100452 RepID=A0A8S3ZM24_9EUPU|nr:unnamed protein product [Candidula unifasciata]